MRPLSLACLIIALLAAVLLCSPVLAYDRAVRICNFASSRIIHVWATHIDRSDYGRDLLVGNIPSDTCRTIDPGISQGYCMFDWKVELKDGRSAARRLNACEVEQWDIY